MSEITVERLESLLVEVLDDNRFVPPERGTVTWWKCINLLASDLGDEHIAVKREVQDRLAEAKAIHEAGIPPITLRFDGQGNLMIEESS